MTVEQPPVVVDDALEELVTRIGGTTRPGQHRMANAVAAAIQQQRHLMVQAGTGTGKSFAYLLPTMLAAVEQGTRALVATSTLALQRQLMANDIPAVIEAAARGLPRRPKAALIKGRGNYLCRLRLDEGGAGPGEGAALFEVPGRLEAQALSLRRWAEETATGDRDDLPERVDPRVWRTLAVSGRECVGRQRCPVGDACFAEAARDAAAEADVVVTNHTLLAIDLTGDADVLPEYGVAVIDEAHDLVTRMTQASTATLSVGALTETMRSSAGLLEPHIVEACTQAGEALSSALSGSMPAGADLRVRDLPDSLTRALALVRDASHAAVTDLAGHTDESTLSQRQASTAGFTELHDLAGSLLAGSPDLVRWYAPDAGGLSQAPLTVADQIGSGLVGETTVIATSATLRLGGTFAPLAAAWGLPGQGAEVDPAAPSGAAVATDLGGESARWGWLDVGSPFDYQRQGILYLADDVPPPGRDGTPVEVLARIGGLVRAAGGRALVLASSWRAVDSIAEYLDDASIPAVEILVQQRGEPVGPLVAQFAADERSVLVGTLSLWQGVDAPGSSCSLVVMDKIPFPRPDEPVLAARSEAASERGESGFAAVSLPHAALLLAQGSGRLIRTESDRGVVALLDPRVVRKSYGRYLQESLPDMWRTSDFGVVEKALQRLTASDPA